MFRPLPLCLPILALVSALIAADPPKKDEAPTKTTIPLTVSAMAEPRPALRYTLLPELKDMNPGNPIYAYTKCFAEQHNFYHQKSAVDQREKWLVMPLKDLPLDEVMGNYGGYALRQADYAARLDTPDWQLLLRAKSEGIDLLLPDLQQQRSLASALIVRFRAEIAAKRFDDAVKTAQTLFALSRHLSEHPSLIGNLVGIAIGSLSLRPLEEMLGQPGGPNLYWALTDLPSPFIDLRKGMQGEKLCLFKEFAPFDRDTPIDAAEIDKVLKRLDQILHGIQLQEGLSASLSPAGGWIPVIEEKRPNPSDLLRERAKDAALVGAARKRVVDMGSSEEKAKALPALQILLIDAKNSYVIRRDDEAKWINTPWPKAEAAVSKLGKPGEFYEQLVPSTTKIARARTRLDQRFALLRHVEAVRLYAAAHGGKLPASLADIDVPLPDDPFSGKPFPYAVEGKTAVIRGTPPRGMEKVAGFNVEYRVTIR
jgi:hypothetical protein